MQNRLTLQAFQALNTRVHVRQFSITGNDNNNNNIQQQQKNIKLSS